MGPDLTPATQSLAKTVTDISNDELGAQTPCLGVTVADLLDHVDALFGPPVPVPDDAPQLDKLIGLTGRYPGWRQAVR